MESFKGTKEMFKPRNQFRSLKGVLILFRTISTDTTSLVTAGTERLPKKIHLAIYVASTVLDLVYRDGCYETSIKINTLLSHNLGG